MSKFRVITTVDESLVEIIENPDFKYMALDVEAYSSDPKEIQGALDCTLARIRLISLMTETWDCPLVIDVKLISNDAYITKLFEVIDIGHEEVFTLIAHNASYEFTVIYHNFGVKLNHIKDTRTAIATLDVANGWKEGNFRGRKLDDIAWHFFGVELDKTLQVSDWSGKLSHAQYGYSALDVGAPENILNPYTQFPMYSIVIEFYRLMETVCDKELNMLGAFELDQACVPITSDMEANGIPLNIPLCEITRVTLNKIQENCLQKLCTGLGRRLQLDLITGELIVPDDLQKLLNNSKKLLKVINTKLPPQQKLSDVQMSSLEILLKELDSEKEEEEDIENELAEEREELWKTRVLIKDLLEYKKYLRVTGEVGKYLSAVRPKTNCIHGSFNVVGAGTSRTSSGGGNKSLNLQSIPSSYIAQEVTKSELIGGSKTTEKYRVNISVRTLFGKPYDSDFLWCSLDYASQELRIASAISRDTAMLDVFRLQRDNPYLINPNTNKEYSNPLCDLHIVAARKMYSFLENVPLWELEKASVTPLSNGDVPRKVGKIVNFCVSLEAEALTKHGWRKYGEFSCDDEILTYDTEQQCYVWCKPTAINFFENQETLLLDYKGDHNIAEESSSTRWKVITTPNHRWWTFTGITGKERREGKDTLEFRTSEYIQKNTQSTKLYLSSSRKDSGSDLVEEWDELMIICVVLYHLDLDTDDKTIYKGKYLYKEEVDNLNNNLGYIWVKDYIPCDTSIEPKPINPVLQSRLTKKDRNRYTAGYGHALFDTDIVNQVFSKYGIEPYNTSTWYDFIHKLNNVTLDEMFNIYEDLCSVHKKRIRTMSFHNKHIKDFVQVIGILVGYTITDLDSSGINSFLYKSTKTINSCKCEGMYVYNHTPQDVWCPTTPTGTWVMRHENFIGITGNSVLYGKSDKGFAEAFGLSIEATRILIKAYSSGFPELFKWIEEVGNRAKYEKTIRSLYGRVVFVFEANAKGEDSESAGVRKAVNALIQTSAGDMAKLAMKYIKEDKELYKIIRMCSIVHDKESCRG